MAAWTRGFCILFACFFVSCPFGLTSSASADEVRLNAAMQRAAAYLKNGEVEKAIPIFKSEAKRGNAGAKNALGEAYHRGYGVKRDIQLSVYWFIEAWKDGGAARTYAAEQLAKINTETGVRMTSGDVDNLLKLKTFIEKQPINTDQPSRRQVQNDSGDGVMHHFMFHNFVERGNPLDFGFHN